MAGYPTGLTLATLARQAMRTNIAGKMGASSSMNIATSFNTSANNLLEQHTIS
jgi:hypothetical protein